MRSPHTTTGEQPPLLVTRESLCAGMKIQHRQKQINEQIFKKKNALTPSSSMTSLPLHRPWTISNTWQLSLPQKNKTLSRSLSFYINWLSARTPLFSVPFFTSCTDFWSHFIYHFFWCPWTGETGSDSPPMCPHTPLLLPPLLPTS